jgi:hypothetical protein
LAASAPGVALRVPSGVQQASSHQLQVREAERLGAAERRARIPFHFLAGQGEARQVQAVLAEQQRAAVRQGC